VVGLEPPARAGSLLQLWEQAAQAQREQGQCSLLIWQLDAGIKPAHAEQLSRPAAPVNRPAEGQHSQGCMLRALWQ
jgi:hypothetical protein